jgi:hypothetical protein
MIPLVLRLALALTALFTLVALAARLQVRDDTPLRALLLPPEGCAAPCFLGVRPGDTATTAALDRLAALVPGALAQPRISYSVRLAASPGLGAGEARLLTAGERVAAVLWTPGAPLTLGDLLLALGPPQQATIAFTEQLYSNPLMLAYPAHGLTVFVEVRFCDLRADALLRAPPGAVVVSASPAHTLVNRDLIASTPLKADIWARHLRQFNTCRGRRW